jgi:MAX-like protein X
MLLYYSSFDVSFSFTFKVSMNNFAELSGCVFAWIEEQCKPGELQELMAAILRQV